MRTQEFTAFIYKLQYKKIENENIQNMPPQYCIQAILLECKQGSKAKRTYHNALLYISEEQYENQALSKMDKIKISNKAKWVNKYMSLNIYDQKKLKELNETHLQKDVNGKTFAKVSFYAYTLRAQQDEWSVVEKADEACYIQCGKVKFYIPEHQINDDCFCFFFDEDIYKKIEPDNMTEFEMNCYLHKQKKWRKLIELQSAFDEDSGRYFANLIIKDKGEE